MHCCCCRFRIDGNDVAFDIAEHVHWRWEIEEDTMLMIVVGTWWRFLREDDFLRSEIGEWWLSEGWCWIKYDDNEGDEGSMMEIEGFRDIGRVFNREVFYILLWGLLRFSFCFFLFFWLVNFCCNFCYILLLKASVTNRMLSQFFFFGCARLQFEFWFYGLKCKFYTGFVGKYRGWSGFFFRRSGKARRWKQWQRVGKLGLSFCNWFRCKVLFV